VINHGVRAKVLALKSYLFTAITRESVVPHTLERTSQWLLVTVVAVGSYSSRKAENGGGKLHLAGIKAD
jgi:hypothetical protein